MLAPSHIPGEACVMPETLSNDPYGDLRDAARDHLIRYGGDFFPFIVERASGSYFHDTDGRAIPAFASGQMFASLGHNHPALVAAIQKRCREVIPLYHNMLAPGRVAMGRALPARLPPRPLKAGVPPNGGE